MVREWNGSFVHVSEFEPKQPQLEPKPMNGDSISLRNVRPDRTETAVPILPVNAFTITEVLQLYLLMNQIMVDQQVILLDLEMLQMLLVE